MIVCIHIRHYAVNANDAHEKCCNCNRCMCLKVLPSTNTQIKIFLACLKLV